MFACPVHESMIVASGAVVVVVQAPASLGRVLGLDDLPACRGRAQRLAQLVLPPLPHRHRRPLPLPAVAVAPDAVVLAAAPAEFPHLHVTPATTAAVDAPGVAETVPEAAARAAHRAEEAQDGLPRELAGLLDEALDEARLPQQHVEEHYSCEREQTVSQRPVQY
jgi:hypothetical protein